MSIESPGQARTQSNPDNDWDRQGELRVDTSSSLRASPLPFATRTITISNSDSAAELLGRCSAKPLSRSAKSCCVLRAACCVCLCLCLCLCIHVCVLPGLDSDMGRTTTWRVKIQRSCSVGQFCTYREEPYISYSAFLRFPPDSLMCALYMQAAGADVLHVLQHRQGRRWHQLSLCAGSTRTRSRVAES